MIEPAGRNRWTRSRLARPRRAWQRSPSRSGCHACAARWTCGTTPGVYYILGTSLAEGRGLSPAERAGRDRGRAVSAAAPGRGAPWRSGWRAPTTRPSSGPGSAWPARCCTLDMRRRSTSWPAGCCRRHMPRWSRRCPCSTATPSSSPISSRPTCPTPFSARCSSPSGRPAPLPARRGRGLRAPYGGHRAAWHLGGGRAAPPAAPTARSCAGCIADRGRARVGRPTPRASRRPGVCSSDVRRTSGLGISSTTSPTPRTWRTWTRSAPSWAGRLGREMLARDAENVRGMPMALGEGVSVHRGWWRGEVDKINAALSRGPGTGLAGRRGDVLLLCLPVVVGLRPAGAAVATTCWCSTRSARWA